MNEKYEAIIGLEIHVQLATQSKMFCSCSNSGENKPVNTTVCPVCMGHPGTLPVPNREAIRMGIMIARALECRVPERSKFDRKSYFYPDLPKGYQISQFDEPIGLDGHLNVQLGEHIHRVGITRLHLEEDAAKLTHAAGRESSVVDFNRSGSPLAEIVTEPDMRSPEEAGAFLRELRLIVRYLGVSDGDMEKGHLRCDANISLRPKDKAALWPKTEIKNLNSFRSVERALVFEIERQEKLWDVGKPEDVSSTRGWDEASGMTVLQRTKEESADYRYFPEPDIPPLEFTNEYLREVEATTPELPAARRTRFTAEYALPKKDIEVLVQDKRLGDFVESVISELQAWVRANGKDWERERSTLTKQTVNLVINRFSKFLVDHSQTVDSSRVTAENMAEFVTIVASGSINNQAAQKVLALMFQTGKDPSQIVEEQGLAQMDDASALTEIVQHVLEAHPNVVEDVKAGKRQALMFLVGQVMTASKGKANPQVVQKILRDKLS